MGADAKGLSIGIIMDGNGRWAKKRGLPRTAGHKKGADVFDDITRYANEQGVAAITYYAFSNENWTRPQDEIDTIMGLLRTNLKKMFRYTKENNRVLFLGDRSPLDKDMQDMMNEIERDTAQRTGMILNIAINYGGQQELVRAAKQLAAEVAEGRLAIEDIDEAALEARLYTGGQPMPDVVIRTSGEERISNFLLWQSAYAELVFTDTLWPDFTRKEFDKVIEEYHSRDRRFGGV